MRDVVGSGHERSYYLRPPSSMEDELSGDELQRHGPHGKELHCEELYCKELYLEGVDLEELKPEEPHDKELERNELEHNEFGYRRIDPGLRVGCAT
jgi:hypothetical protein